MKIDKLFPEEFKSLYGINFEMKDIGKKLINYLQSGIQNDVNPSTMILVLKLLKYLNKLEKLY